MTAIDGRAARGALSRANVMRLAVDLASVEGLEGLSIGTLARGTNLSKSGVVALFGTKQSVQLAAVETAREIFLATVVRPALQVAGGRARLDALLEGWLRYSENRVFAGGCFFIAASVDVASRPGPVRDAVVTVVEEWNDVLRRVITRAVDHGELEAPADIDQLVFEVRALLDGANGDSLLFGSVEPYRRAAIALERLFPR